MCIRDRPQTFQMDIAYPNPFNRKIVISISLSHAQSINLAIYNNRGKLIHTLVKESIYAGKKLFTWNGLTDNGVAAPTGIYLVRLASADRFKTQKIILLK